MCKKIPVKENLMSKYKEIMQEFKDMMNEIGRIDEASQARKILEEAQDKLLRYKDNFPIEHSEHSLYQQQLLEIEKDISEFPLSYHVKRASVFLEEGNTNGAKAEFEKAIELSKRRFEATGEHRYECEFLKYNKLLKKINEDTKRS